MLYRNITSDLRANYYLPKGPKINIVKGPTLGFWCCQYATKINNKCKLAVCVDCHGKLLEEHGLDAPPVRDRKYKFPGCENHTYEELEFKQDIGGTGAYWCDQDWKEYEAETRPIGCVLCLKPFQFHASNKSVMKEN